MVIQSDELRASGTVEIELLVASEVPKLQFPNVLELGLIVLSLNLHQVISLRELSYGQLGTYSSAFGPHIDAIQTILLLFITNRKATRVA